MRILVLTCSFLLFSCFAQAQVLQADTGRIKNIKLHKKGNDHIDLSLEFEIQRTKDPVTGKVPRELLAEANRKAENSQKLRRNSAGRATAALTWAERGSNSDGVGSSNGNTRANGAVTSGRMRAIWPDLSDATGNTVWVGGVDGGIWKTTNISSTPATWNVVNDYLSNLSVSGICQDPSNTSILYFCTGESFGNVDAVQGNGVYKSTDGGATWNQLSSTTSYLRCTKILCDETGNVYLATVGNGLLRSSNGGTSWTTITPTGLSSSVPDFEISSTGRMHVYCGLSSSTNGYRFTNTPSTVTSSGWTAATTPFTVPASSSRIELACSGTVLYAAISNSSAIVATVGKSVDAGVTWTTTTLTTIANQALNGTNSTSQAWYCLTAGIDPSNTNNAMLGNLNIISTTDGGTTWVKGSEWVGTSGQYVHADQHAIVWYNNGNKLLFGTDGGIHFSSDKGATIRDRNIGLRIKQFYSVAIHPSSTNYFLAGAQDNGTHQFSNAGLSSSVEVTGGDGAYVAIDQDQPQYQFGAYVYSAYRRSTNSGSSWGSINFYKGTSAAPTNFGQFINPYALDNTNNIIYAAAGGGEIFRWTTPQTTATGNYYLTDGFPAGASILTGITNLSSQVVSAVKVSPFTANRVYFGTVSGKLIYIDNANTAASATAGTNITGASFPAGNVSSINHGTSEQNLIVCFSNYNVSNIWISSNGGTSWTTIDGNLPNMPVRWAMFYPNDNTKAIIATDTGIWETDLINGASTVWTANPTFPVVRTDMLQYRVNDGLLAAATHGRGLFTTNISACATTPTISVTPGTAAYCSPSGAAISLTASGALTYAWSPSTGLSANTGAVVNANPSVSTVYTVTGYDANGCSGNATATINVAPSVSVSAVASPASVCSGGNATITATATLASSAYCQPAYSNGTGSGDFIAQVSVATTTLSNTTIGAASPYYTLYPATGSTTGTFNAGTLYTMTVKGGTFSICYIRGWIDFNGDGNFSSSESIGISGNVGSSATGTFNFTIPNSAFNGSSRLRLRSSDTAPGPTSEESCGSTNSGYGETEDYVITIAAGTNMFTYAWSPSTFLSSTTTNPTTANAVTSNTTYTVVASSSGCTSSAQATVTINTPTVPTGTNASRCGTGTVIISAASSGNVIDWYAASSGGSALLSSSNSFTTPSIAATTIYYAESRNATTGCISASRTAVTATVNPLTSSATGTSNARCGTGIVAISATSSGNVIDWYAASTGGTALLSGSDNYTTPSISTTTIYYAESRNVTTGCIAASRTAVTATVNSLPSTATGTNNARCGTGTVVISAASSGNVIDWYAASTGGTALLSSSNSFTTPSIAVTTIYYAESRNATTGCISSSRVAVTATVNSVPSAPSGTAGQRCGSGTVLISASSSGNVIDWYSASSGGTSLLSGNNSYTTPVISNTTTYYAQSRNAATTCFSATRTGVIATVNTNPSTPVITAGGPISFCNGGTVTLTSSAATSYLWSNGATTQAITVSASGDYTVTISNAAGCTATSSATSVAVSACAVTLNVKLFLQGFYTGASTMSTNLFDLGISNNSNASDSVNVDLWSTNGLNNPSPSYTQKVIVLKNGTTTATFPGVVNGQRFYIAIRHRNHLETWSADSILMSTVTNYDFTNAITKAYSDGFTPPMINLASGIYGFYGGDINHDGAVDGADMSILENGASAFEFGYNYGDLNGDGATDGADMSLLENNTSLFLFYSRPYQQRYILRRLFSRFKR